MVQTRESDAKMVRTKQQHQMVIVKIHVYQRVITVQQLLFLNLGVEENLTEHN
jgi:hypothetical protein